LVDAAAYFTEVEKLVATNGAGSWTDVRHVKVPPQGTY